MQLKYGKLKAENEKIMTITKKKHSNAALYDNENVFHRTPGIKIVKQLPVLHLSQCSPEVLFRHDKQRPVDRSQLSELPLH